MSSQTGTIFLPGANGGLGRGIIFQINSTPELAGCHRLDLIRNDSTAQGRPRHITGSPAVSRIHHRSPRFIYPPSCRSIAEI
ncbi:hypothetical protein F5Y14DRAFT_146713 [Nemania sp. NC0429]|nr:hypothetical protein F5Y14DRAFT_146713 [Nemania sp. NC0429]